MITKSMEKAVFVSNLVNLKYVTAKYDRLYFGNEFCERLIPAIAELKRVVSFARDKGLAFTFVSPYVTDSGLARLKPLLDGIEKSGMSCECVVNDWGILNLIARDYPGISPVLGRLLVKQKRCPSLIRLLKRHSGAQLVKNPQRPALKRLVIQKKLPLELDAYYKGSNASSVPIIHDLLFSLGVRRIELDNVGQGLSLRLPKGKISSSVYFPYIYITTTFFCLSAGCDTGDSVLKIKSCHKECGKYTFKFRHKSFPKEILLKGNTQFYKNARCHLEKWRKMGVDRIVFEPEIPVN